MINSFKLKGVRIIICEADERVAPRLGQAHVLEHLGGIRNFLPDPDSALKAASEYQEGTWKKPA